MACAQTGLGIALRALRALDTRLVWHQQIPVSSKVSGGDIVVMDLDALEETVSSVEVRALGGHHLLVAGNRKLAPFWTQLAVERPHDWVLCPGAGDLRFQPAIAKVLRMTIGQSPQVLTHAVLADNPHWVGRLEEPIRAFCEHPDSIRRPRDLAAALGMPLARLRKQCVAAGHVRVEHLITEIRVAVRSHLLGRLHLARPLADTMAGVTDESNLRRQLRRARDGGGAGPGLLALVLSLAITCASCGGSDRDAQAVTADSARERGEPVALPVVGALVRRGDLVLSVRATGAVRADRLVNLKSETQGTVADVTVRPGDHVAAGQLLVRLDPRPLDLAIGEAEAAVAEARMRLQDALLGVSEGDTATISRDRRENARVRSGIVAAEARLERAQLERQRADIAAPFPGVLDAVGVVTGQHLGPGDPIARLVDLSTLTIEASVLEHDLPLLRVGGSATVLPSANSGARLRGTIVAVLPIVDTASRSGRALVRVRGEGGVLRPGMYADVELEATRLTNRVLVPSAAVIDRDGRPLVFRVHRGRAEWVYVLPGRSNGTETEILADSTSGQPAVSPLDTVLVSGHLTLTHDAPVRLQIQGPQAHR